MRIDNIALEFVKQAIKSDVSDKKLLQKLKNEFSVKYKIPHLSSVELIKAYENLVENGEIDQNFGFEKVIRKRAVRSLSGIASITVITKDFDCPGKCIYCPKEPDMPKSYLSNEPACMRAILNDFDPYRQVVARLKGLKKTGHVTSKIEKIISGGTFNYYPSSYQMNFVKGVLNGLNFDRGVRAKTLKDAQKLNEKSLHRCVGLSVETRPDYVDKKTLINFRKLGCTKVEVGVQCLDDKIYRLNNRGHGVKEVRNALKLLKDAGFKINVHFMPNMYGSSPKKDLEMFKKLFSDPDFRPDWLKIYPCVVVPYSPLEKIYRAGKHKPYSDKKLIALLIKLKKIVPEYCRITRLYRDIPAESIIGGTKISNLRQYVQAEMIGRGEKCRCIRCREIKGDDFDPENVKLIVREYDSSSGKEYFLSFEDVKNDKIVGYLRLRIPSCYKNHWIGELTNSAIIRELHIFGEHVKVNNRLERAGQHKGYGKKLIEKAVELTKSHNVPRLAVISGVGVRDYYRKLGFKDGGLYQVLTIKNGKQY